MVEEKEKYNKYVRNDRNLTQNGILKDVVEAEVKNIMREKIMRNQQSVTMN